MPSPEGVATDSNNSSENATEVNEPETNAETPSLPESSDVSSNSPSWISLAIQVLIYGLMIAISLWVIIKHRTELIEAFRQLWLDLKHLFTRRPRQTTTAMTPQGDTELPPRPFAEFQDPFATGEAYDNPPEEIISYSYRAMRAWASERDITASADQTPMEFAGELAAVEPGLAQEANQVSRLYITVAYTEIPAPPNYLEILQSLWKRLQ